MRRAAMGRAIAALLTIALPLPGCERAPARAPADLLLTEIDTVITVESGLLAAPVDVAVDEAGRVYVLDYQLAAVLVLSDLDHPPLLYGGEGAGPGEFRGPSALAATVDSIRVVELGNGRIQVLAADGRHARSYPLPAAFPGGISLSPSGRMAVPTQGFRENSLVLTFDAEGAPAGRAGEPVVPPHQMWSMDEISSEIERDRVPASLRNMSRPVIEDDGSLWLVLEAEGVVRRYDGEASLLWSLALDAPELESIREDFFTRNRELTSPGFVALSYVSDAVSVGGELWLLLNTPAEEPTVVLVVTSDGQPGGRITLPGIHEAGDMAVDRRTGRLYLTLPDEASLVATLVPRRVSGG